MYWIKEGTHTCIISRIDSGIHGVSYGYEGIII
jgi:hypothetical protein